MEASKWDSVAHHLFMPRELPSQEHEKTDPLLLESFLEFLESEKSNSSIINEVYESIRLWNSPFSSYKKHKENALIPIFLPLQNTLLCMRKKDEEYIIFGIDLFSDDDSNCSFDEMKKRKFFSRVMFPRLVISTTSAQLDSVKQDFFQLSKDPHYATRRKAKTNIEDNRKQYDSKIVFNYILPSLVGKTVKSPVEIWKKIRIEAISPGEGVPWRRSSTWIGIKYFIHLFLTLEKSKCENYLLLYKGLIIKFLSFFIRKLNLENIEYIETFELVSDCLKKIARKAEKIQARFGINKETEEILTYVNKKTETVYSALKITWESSCETWELKNTIDLIGPVVAVDNWTIDTREIEENIEKIKELISKGTSETSKLPPPSKVTAINMKDDCIDIITKLKTQLENASEIQDNIYALRNVEYYVHKEREKLISTKNSLLLHELLVIYYSKASAVYSNDEFLLQSTKLVTMALLVACLDRIACDEYPLLWNHKPPIDLSLFKKINLITQIKLESAQWLEEYFELRIEKASENSIFQLDGSGFMYNYARSNISILDWLRKERLEIQKQRGIFKTSYEKLQTYWSNHQRYCSAKSWEYCCDCENRYVHIYEESLPQENVPALIIGYEIFEPATLRTMREAFALFFVTWDSRETKRIRLYSWERSKGNLILSSNSAPFPNSNIKVERYANSDSAVVPCGKKVNALQFKKPHQSASYFEWKEGEWILPFKVNLEKPYKSLEWMIIGTEHTQNQVLASQDNCPLELDIREYIEFGSLRSGGFLQLINIMRNMEARTLSFHHQGVFTAILYSITQLGPSNISSKKWLRDWKIDLLRSDFVMECCQIMSDFLESVAQNWERHLSVKTIITLLRTILMVDKTNTEALKLMRRCREIAGTHIQKILAVLLDHKLKPEDAIQLNKDLLAIAYLLIQTYYVEHPESINALLAGSEDIITYLQTLILIRDKITLHPTLSSQPLGWIEVTTFLLPYLHNQFSKGLFSPLEDIVYKTWNVAKSGKISNWKRLEQPRETWYSCTFVKEKASKKIQIDLLSGSFLVDGATVGYLPQEITSSSHFNRVFETNVFEVLPSSIPNFYDSKKFGESYFTFGVLDESVIIRETFQGETFQLIDNSLFSSLNLPKDLVDNYSQWANLSKNKVVFRPKNWKKDGFLEHKYDYELEIGKRRLTHVKSQRWIAKIPNESDIFKEFLSRIEDDKHIHMLAKEGLQNVEFFMPRMNLHFDIDLSTQNIQILAREFGETSPMKISKSQYIGTLIGFHNALVLEGRNSFETKKVIVPFVKSHRREGDSIFANWESFLASPPYLIYDIESNIKKLRSPSVFSKLYLAYLHVITSRSYADPFTELKGFDSAVIFLLECWRNSPFDKISAIVIEMILNLSPKRSDVAYEGTYNEQVEWSNLGSWVSFDSLGILTYAIWSKSLELKELFQTKIYKMKELNLVHSICAAFKEKSFIDQVFSEDLWDKICKILQVSLKTSKHIVSDWPPGAKKVVDVIKIDFQKLQSNGSFIKEVIDEFESNKSKYHSNDEFPENWRETFSGLYELARSVGSGKESILKLRLRLAIIAFIYPIENLDYFALFWMIAKKPILANSLPQIPSKMESGTFHFSTDTVEDVAGSVESKYRDRISHYQTALWQALDRFCDSSSAPSYSTFPVSRRTWYADRDVFRKNPCPELADLYDTYAQRKEFFEFLQEIHSKVILHQQSFTPVSHHTLSLPYYPPNGVPPKEITIIEHKTNIIEDKEASEIFKTGRYNFLENLFDECVIALTESSTHERKVPDFQLHFPTSKMASEYMKELKESWKICHQSKTNPPSLEVNAAYHLESVILISQKRIQKYADLIKQSLSPLTIAGKLLENSGLWHVTAPLIILPKIAQSKDIDMKLRHLIVSYGVFITYLQKAKRCLTKLKNLSANDRFGKVQLAKEIANKRSGWTPEEFPEWLLFEIEQDLLIREVQVLVSRKMMESTESKQNQVLQLNMGEGKTSVIIPIVCSVLSNREKLVRVTVLSSLFATNYEDLGSRLSGLLGRSIYTFPCQRNTPITPELMQNVLKQYEEALQTRSCILTVPEHRLSFQLKHAELLTCNSNSKQLIAPMEKVLKWTHQKIFDLLDESDEILRHKYQIIYPTGADQIIDGGSRRWKIVQSVFQLIKKIASEISYENPNFTEYREPNQDSNWPHFRITDAVNFGPELIKRIVDHLVQGGVEQIDFANKRQEVKEMIKKCLLESGVDNQVLQKTMNDLGTAKNDLLILRGLLSYEVLIYALCKRWSVDYGLHSTNPKKRMAVPFRAKDTSSERTEFGQPDIAVIFTHLSYYNQGLSREQVRMCLERLQSDNNEAEYKTWVDFDPNIPNGLQHFSALNMTDYSQVMKLYDLFHKNMRTINFYLNCKVLPIETRQFQTMLVANAWDLAVESNHPVRGFSGTKDNKLLLPLSIHQVDIPQLSGTDGEVISSLLLPENSEYHHLPKAASSKEILTQMLASMKGSVLIDCGALMIEMSNQKVVEEWMKKNEQIEGGIYFEENKLMALDRQGNALSFKHSSLRQRLGKCVVYLDDYHTRGTDLKLPIPTHAFVTIGPKMQKDKLVQACMRMRQLGVGHTVSFYASHEVHLSLTSMFKNVKLSTKEVIEWCIYNTVTLSEDSMLQWATQGLNYATRACGQKALQNNNSAFQKLWVFPDAATLEKMYGRSRSKQQADIIVQYQKNSVIEKIRKIFGDENSGPKVAEEIGNRIENRCNKYLHEHSVYLQHLDEEHERELEAELEEEKQIFRPPQVKPHSPSVHGDFIQLLRTSDEKYFTRRWLLSLDNMFEFTNLSKDFEKGAWGEEISISLDFFRTVDAEPLDYYLRPVSHILVCKGCRAVIISPFEANEALKQLHEFPNPNIAIHHFSPLSSRFQRSLILSKLSLNYSPKIFQVPLIKLELLSGSLFFGEKFLEAAEFLGIVPAPGVTKYGVNEKTWEKLLMQGIITESGEIKENKKPQSIEKKDMEIIEKILNTKFTKPPQMFVNKLNAVRNLTAFMERSDIGCLVSSYSLEKDK